MDTSGEKLKKKRGREGYILDELEVVNFGSERRGFVGVAIDQQYSITFIVPLHKKGKGKCSDGMEEEEVGEGGRR